MSDKEEKELVKKRASYKGRLTAFSNYLYDLDDELDSLQVKELQLRTGRIEQLYLQYDEVQMKLECIVSDMDLQIAERNEFESNYYQTLSKAQNLLISLNKKLKTEMTGSEHGVRNHKIVKLPIITLPKYRGSYDNWLEFRDTFTSLIHSNEDIDEINKFHYLRASLEGTAAVVIQSIECSAANYSVAWNLLCERFDNKRLLIQNHVAALFNIESIKTESSANIKSIIDQTNKNLRALQSLDEPTSHWDTLLIHIVSQKLDQKTFREWEECKGKLDKNQVITLNYFLEFLRTRADLLETLEMARSNKTHQNTSGNMKLKTMVSVTNTQQRAEVGNQHTFKPCPKCNGSHPLYNCEQFLSLSNEQRMELLPQYKLCYNCFRSNHYSNQCKKGGCKICKRKHNTLIHISDIKKPTNIDASTSNIDSNKNVKSTSQAQAATNLTLTTCMNAHLEPEQDVLLSTALVEVLDKHGHAHIVRALLDCASSSCIMTEKLSCLLDLPFVNVDKPIYGINKSKTLTTRVCQVKMQSMSERYSCNLQCYVLPAITDEIPCRRVNVHKLNIPTDINLADPQFYEPSDVDLVLGSNIFWDLLGSQKIKLGENKPILWETRLGWLVSGPINSGHKSSPLICNFTKIDGNSSDFHSDDGQNMLARFWQIEEVNQKSSFSKEDQNCENHFVKTTTRLDDGRFCVRIPLTQSSDVLGDSLTRAKSCFFSLERKFKREPEFCKMYVDFMSEYISLGHMSECNFESTPAPYFIPHHGVIRESSSTTKLRTVFNASSPTTTGISSNNIQMVGPTVQDDLLSILLRFRQHKYVLAADVEKMYRQVVCHPADRYLQQIVWRANPAEPLKCYQLNTVTYGTASAPFLATRCIKEIGLECNDTSIAEVIIHDMYVDDLLTGANDYSDALNIKKNVTEVLASYGMPLRKWKSNCLDLVLSEASSNTNDASVNLNIGCEQDKTLGLGWLASSDDLYFFIDCSFSIETTKRGILSVIGKIFDPMGLLAPCIVLLKILMQRLWLHKLKWDDPLPSDIVKIWYDIAKGLPQLNKLRVPRLVVCDSYNALEFHIFTDASQVAYGACLYVRSTNNRGNVTVRLLIAKSRVAPIKPMTIPRLELCGALVGARLFTKAIAAIRANVRETVLWTDSTIVLGWLKMHPNKLQPFVRNRVGEILEQTASNCTFRYVPTKNNPADLISRGVDVCDIQSLDKWWSGPEYLSQDKSQWPPSPITPDVDALPEIRTEISLHTSVSSSKERLIDFERFSNLMRLKHAVAYVLRFIGICKKQTFTNDFISNNELQNAMVLIIRLSQRESFPEYCQLLKTQQIPKKSKLSKFNIFLDDNKLMRVGGRLGNSSFAYDKKFPILIQSTHYISKLLFQYEHIRLMHAGPQLMLATIRETYWPIGGRNLAKNTYHHCVLCTRMKGKVLEPLMGNLPQSRVHPGGYPFECVGVDYAGPILSASRQGRGCRLVKVWIAIFVCFTTKAMHTELVGDLTSNNFLSALRRFISRRGKPRDLYSDNGTSFVGAYNDLGKFLKGSCSSLSESVANDGINFHFIPPYSPHFGGLWESGVRSLKHHLTRVLGNCNLTYEELNTVLVQIEAILNSRPLSPLSSEPSDLMPLTPGHFLIGRPLVALPTQNLQDSTTSHLSRHQRMEKLRQHFWCRWSKEYISELQHRMKWRTNYHTLKADMLVVVKDDNLPPLKWKLGRVVALYPGADNICRVADVKVSNGIIRRSFSKICPLLDISG